MAVKHVKDYYNQICEQYHETIQNIKDFEEECKQGLIEPERLDKIKETIQPIINNYQTLSYIIFLLNMPTKKQKQKGYEQRNKKFLSQIAHKNTKDGLIETNNQTIEKLKKITK